MKKKCVQTALLCAVFSTCLTFGQDAGSPPTPPTPAQMAARQVARLTTLLTLTTAQQTQATAIFTNEATAVSALMTSMKTARSALETAIQSGDTGGISTQATEIGSLTTQEVESRANAQVAFYAILTADQQAKYKQLPAGGPGEFGGLGGRGPGGPPR